MIDDSGIHDVQQECDMSFSFLAKCASRYSLDVSLALGNYIDAEDAASYTFIMTESLLEIRGLSTRFSVGIDITWAEGDLDLTKEFKEYIVNSVKIRRWDEAEPFQGDHRVITMEYEHDRIGIMINSKEKRFP